METNYNCIIIIGHMDVPVYSHDGCYASTIHSQRLSGTHDEIPVIMDEGQRLQISPGEEYLVKGRVYTTNENGSLRMFLRAQSVVPVRASGSVNCNSIEMEGYICKEPVARRTKLGKDVCQLIVANNFEGRPSYIPCVAFSELAAKCSCCKIGDKIYLTGRLQSRDYLTKDLVEGRTYEVAIKSVKFKN